MKLGIIANEFFHPDFGGMGGFGWAAKQAADCFQTCPKLGVKPVYLSGAEAPIGRGKQLEVHGTPIIFRQRNLWAYRRQLRAEQIDLLLSIDYRPAYSAICWALPRTPLLIWVRDPRPREDIDIVNSLRIPGSSAIQPAGIEPINCRGLARVTSFSRWLSRQIVFASPAPGLLEKAVKTYAVKIETLHLLPNPVDLPTQAPSKNSRPSVVFLGRLDSIKRPWLFFELARRFPQVDFLMLGRQNIQSLGVWSPDSIPSNLKILGHVEGDEKSQILSSAWVLINTSIHEGFPVSLLEGLAHEMALLGCVDPCSIVSRFGVFVGRWNGTGQEGLPAFAEGLERLLTDSELRDRRAGAGRRWVEETHTPQRFLESFMRLSAAAGVPPGVATSHG